jgi:hypothetical protein
MENTPFNPSPFESPSSGVEKLDKDGKKEKKKAATAETTVDADKKQKAQRELAKSIDKLPLFERQDSSVSDKKPEASAEQLVDELTKEEQKHVQQETAQEHLAAIEQADPETAEALQPAAEFLQRVAEGQDVEEAFGEAAAEAGLTEEEIAALAAETPTEVEAETETETEAEAEAQEDSGVIDTASDTEGVVGWRTTTSSTPSTARAGGTNGSGGTPPPTAPFGGGSATGGSAGGGPGAGAQNRTSVANLNALPPTAESYYQQRNKAGELLLIGLVGYLIGRRRGRIRTEKRLLPVQRKLEKQVKQLEQDITYKEQKLVAIKTDKQRAEARPLVAPLERTQPGRTETRLGMEKPVRAERLGHMVIAAEAPRKTAERAPDPKANNLRQAYRAESVPAMSRNELLELSEKIIVEGASLRRIYESNLVGERQLRHLVSEYLQGKDIRKDLRKEMVEHEIDFERDPILRDRVRSRLVNSSDGGGLGEMLAKAGVTDKQADPAFDHMVQRDQQRQAATERKQKQQRLIVDVLLVTAIVVLMAVVAILAPR